MGLQKYVSDVTKVNWNNELVYSRLANFETLNFIFNKENFEKAKGQLGAEADKLKIKNFTANRDVCSFDVDPVGKISLEIIEREHPKTIKISSANQSNPLDFTLWIQVLPVNSTTSKLRLTLHIELNMMMKMMIGGKIKDGINKFAQGIAMLPFGAIPDETGIRN